MSAALKSVTVLPDGFCSLEDERMGQIGKLTTADAAAGSEGGKRGMPRADSFSAHQRVREATAEERRGLERSFPDRDRSRWVSQTLRSKRAWALVVETFENRQWVPLGHAIVDSGGLMALCILPRHRRQGRSPAAIRAALRYLREYPLSVLTARVGDAESAAARAFERAGFVFSGQAVSAGRVERRYDFVIRGECTPFNVWI
jgi:RimJ/RimL family protein N-acetyltransferase